VTEITTDQPQPVELTDLRPSEALMALIVALLAPMFLGVTAGDINLACLPRGRPSPPTRPATKPT
jgi:hypothetical protein